MFLKDKDGHLYLPLMCSGKECVPKPATEVLVVVISSLMWLALV